MLGWSLSRILVGCENDTEHQLCRIRVYHLLQTSCFLIWRHSKVTSCIHSAVISLFILYFILVFDKIVVRPCAVEVFLSWNLLPVNPRMSWHSVGVKGSSCGTEEAYQSLCSCWNLDFFLIRFIVHTFCIAVFTATVVSCMKGCTHSSISMLELYRNLCKPCHASCIARPYYSFQGSCGCRATLLPLQSMLIHPLEYLMAYSVQLPFLSNPVSRSW